MQLLLWRLNSAVRSSCVGIDVAQLCLIICRFWGQQCSCWPLFIGFDAHSWWVKCHSSLHCAIRIWWGTTITQHPHGTFYSPSQTTRDTDNWTILYTHTVSTVWYSTSKGLLALFFTSNKLSISTLITGLLNKRKTQWNNLWYIIYLRMDTYDQNTLH